MYIFYVLVKKKKQKKKINTWKFQDPISQSVSEPSDLSWGIFTSPGFFFWSAFIMCLAVVSTPTAHRFPDVLHPIIFEWRPVEERGKVSPEKWDDIKKSYFSLFVLFFSPCEWIKKKWVYLNHVLSNVNIPMFFD